VAEAETKAVIQAAFRAAFSQRAEGGHSSMKAVTRCWLLEPQFGLLFRRNCEAWSVL